MPFVLGPGFFGPAPNLGSPVPIRDKLYLIDHNDAVYAFRDDGSSTAVDQIFQVGDAPAGLMLDNRQSIVNVAPGKRGNQFHIMFTSAMLPPDDIPLYALPAPLPGVCCDVGTPIPVPDLYRLGAAFDTRTEFQVLYEYTLTGTRLRDPRAVAAFETQSGPTHNGGGMAALRDGRLLFATGDALPFGAEGRAAPQHDASHLSKILIIDPADSSIEVAAKGSATSSTSSLCWSAIARSR